MAKEHSIVCTQKTVHLKTSYLSYSYVFDLLVLLNYIQTTHKTSRDRRQNLPHAEVFSEILFKKILLILNILFIHEKHGER